MLTTVRLPQEVVFHYAAYNESGRRIDSSYQKGQPARTRMGIQGLIPGKRLYCCTALLICKLMRKWP